MPMTPAEKTLASRAGAYAQQAKHDTRETTRNARAAFNSRFEREVDPDRVLSDHERARRAEAARKAYMTLLAYKSAASRRAKSTATRTRKTAA